MPNDFTCQRRASGWERVKVLNPQPCNILFLNIPLLDSTVDCRAHPPITAHRGQNPEYNLTSLSTQWPLKTVSKAVYIYFIILVLTKSWLSHSIFLLGIFSVVILFMFFILPFVYFYFEEQDDDVTVKMVCFISWVNLPVVFNICPD